MWTSEQIQNDSVGCGHIFHYTVQNILLITVMFLTLLGQVILQLESFAYYCRFELTIIDVSLTIVAFS